MVSEAFERVKIITSLVYRTGYLPFKQEERVQLPREVLQTSEVSETSEVFRGVDWSGPSGVS